MSLFTRLPISVADPSLPVIDSADIDALGVSYELDSYDHWVFNTGDVAGLVGLNKQRVLTPQAAVAAYASNYLSLSSLAGNALLSDLDDVALGKYTLCTIVREPAPQATGIKPIYGTVTAAPVANNLTFLSGSNAGSTPARKVFASYSGLTNSLDTNAALAADAWYFVATSVDFKDDTSHTMRTLVGGATPLEAAGNSAHFPSGRKWALGNGWYSAAIGGAFNFAEFILYNRALSTAELQAVYGRSKARMAGQGIAVV